MIVTFRRQMTIIRRKVDTTMIKTEVEECLCFWL